MTSLAYATAELENCLYAVQRQMETVQELIKDHAFSLEDRWELYLKAEKLLPVESFYSDSIKVLTGCVYDDLGLDRYQTRLNSEIDEQLLENEVGDEAPVEDASDWEKKYYERYKLMFAKRDEWREAVLAKGSGGFIYDW